VDEFVRGRKEKAHAKTQRLGRRNRWSNLRQARGLSMKGGFYGFPVFMEEFCGIRMKTKVLGGGFY